jgi:organic radical activating enzyme
MIFVRDEFTSYQGTGHLIGTRQYFVRFAGCSVASCPIRKECDEPDALTRRGAAEVEVEAVVERALASVGRSGWLHITGGEPTDQGDGLQELVKLARKRGLYVHLQTSGIRRVPIQWDWLTVSPKQDIPEQTFGQELVLIDTGDLSRERMQRLVASTSFWCYYLCPLWGHSLASTADLAKEVGDPWSLTMQMHKVGGFK